MCNRSLEAVLLGSSLVLLVSPGLAQPVDLDLAGLSADPGVLERALGSVGEGSLGVPVAGAFDCDGDGHRDVAVAAMRASPLGRSGAGQVFLVFGDGVVGGEIDTAVSQASVLRIAGDDDSEAAGNELWMDDVTGDGLGDLLVARQNHTPDPARIGAGALSIIVGGAALRAHAATLQFLDLRAPPASVAVATFVGAAALDRLGIWMRTGDVDGDGVADIVVGADQADGSGETNRGALYLIRGGPHLAASQTVDLASFGATPLTGHVARVRPPIGSAGFHFGATCQIADLDANGRGEVLAAAALNRAGASIRADGAPAGSAEATGGSLDGTLYVAWDDNFSANPWPAGLDFDVSAAPGGHSVIDGGDCNRDFGEEILGGLDYDGDGTADLFVGDIVGNCAPDSRPNAGSGHVLYDAASLRGSSVDLDALPAGIETSAIFGAAPGDIAADTAAQADFDRDGFGDLAIASPHADPFGRSNAGSFHILYGRAGGWPREIDLNAPSTPQVAIRAVHGANGDDGGDAGDVLGYSAAAGDLDRDGTTDLISNEMLGNGVLPSAEDAGNLLVLSGALLARNTVPASSGAAGWLIAASIAAVAAFALERRRAGRPAMLLPDVAGSRRRRARAGRPGRSLRVLHGAPRARPRPLE